MDTLTFVFTDIEGSTRKWEQFPQQMRAALEWHDALLHTLIPQHGGHVFKTVGDAFCAAFPTALGAIAAVQQTHQALAHKGWENIGPLRIRIALHTGPAQQRGHDYFGATLNRVARLQAIGHGGQTLLSQAAAELVQDALPPGVWLQDLGSHRLKDLGRPEHVFQLCLPDLPHDFPPVRSLQAFANNLPLQMSSFVGREPEMDKVKQMLQSSRLVTLTGAGGTGKTRLALQVAAECLEEYGDGVWFVDLAPLSDPALVCASLAGVLGVREEPGRPLLATLTDHLHSQKTLLLLDNCEHVLGACASLVETLLHSCPGVSVLATSREAVGIGGEQVWRVPALSVPNPLHLPLGEKDLGAVLLDYDGVRLFVERARAQGGEFVLGRGNAGSVSEICSRLDGIPLAIELAAARVRVLSASQISSRLDDRFRLLTGGSRTALPRQQTLRALIDWSYDLLSEREQALLCRLSVFAGGWSMEAAESVCAWGDIEAFEVLDLLTGLVDKSLVMYEQVHEEDAEEDAEKDNVDGEGGRYRLLETVRQYGAERLGESEAAAGVGTRHRDYFLFLAEEAAPLLRGSEAGTWLSRLEREHDNLRAALSWCEAENETESKAENAAVWLRLCAALGWFWDIRGHFSEGRTWLGKALSRTPGKPASSARGRALSWAGNLAIRQCDFGAARTLQEESLEIRRQLGDQRGIADSLNSLGLAASEQGDYGAARTLHEESLQISRQLGNQRGIANSLNSLGLVAHMQGDAGAAHAFHEESLSLCRHLGDQQGIATSLGNLGAVAHMQGDYGAAQALFEESLNLRRQFGNMLGIAYSLCSLGVVTLEQGDAEAARTLHEESLALYRQVGNQRGIAEALEGLARVASEQGDLGAVRALYEESLTLYRRIENRRGIAEALEGLAGVAVSEGQSARGTLLWAAAAALRDQIGAPQSPREREWQGSRREQARQKLGEQAFAAAFAEGQAMTWEQAVEEALEKHRS